MGFRTTAILGILFLALLGFFYFYELEVAEERRRAAEREKSVLSIETEAITRVEVTWADTLLVAVKEGTHWQILEPIRFDGDDGNFHGLTQIAGELDKQRVIAERAAVEAGSVDLSEFGLAEPEVVLVIHQAGGDPDTIYVGDKTPSEGHFYLRRSGNPEILMSSGWRKDFFQKGLFYLRDKQILPFKVLEDIGRIEVASRGRLVEAVKQGESWYLQKPASDRADDDAVRTFLNRVRSGRILRFVDEGGEDLSRYGLDRPSVRLSLFERNEKKTLILGDTTAVNGNTRYYGKYLGRSPVFLIDKSLIAELLVSSLNLRHKQVFRFERAGVDRISLVYPDSTVHCEIDTTSNEWVVLSPVSRLVLSSKVEGLIQKASAIKAKRFVSEAVDDPGRYGLDAPIVRAGFWKGAELRRGITVGKVGDVIYALSDARPEVVELYEAALGELALELIVKRVRSQ